MLGKEPRVILIAFLVTMLGVLGCSPGYTEINANEIVAITSSQGALDDEELIANLVNSFNNAKYHQKGKSWRSTHKLTVTTSDYAIYTLYRIDEDTVEVGLRQGEERRSFFLHSAKLSQVIAEIIDTLRTHEPDEEAS